MQASQFITRVGAAGGIGPIGSQTFPRGQAIRVDVESLAGHNFVPGGRSDASIGPTIFGGP